MIKFCSLMTFWKKLSRKRILSLAVVNLNILYWVWELSLWYLYSMGISGISCDLNPLFIIKIHIISPLLIFRVFFFLTISHQLFKINDKEWFQVTGNNFKDKIDSPWNNYCLSDKILLLKIYTELNDQFKLSKQKKNY